MTALPVSLALVAPAPVAPTRTVRPVRAVEPFATDRPSPSPRVAGRPLVVGLDDPRAREVELAGDRAARLARAAGHGLPVRPGVVLTTEAVGQIEPSRPWPVAVSQALWRGRQELGQEPLLVTASTADDPFGDRGERVQVDPLDGLLALVVAVNRVLASLGDDRHGAAILIQPWPAAERVGVARLVEDGDHHPLMSTGAARQRLRREHRKALRAAIEDVQEAMGGRPGLRWRIVDGRLDLIDLWADTTAARGTLASV
jgi:hypothetical protein